MFSWIMYVTTNHDFSVPTFYLRVAFLSCSSRLVSDLLSPSLTVLLHVRMSFSAQLSTSTSHSLFASTVAPGGCCHNERCGANNGPGATANFHEGASVDGVLVNCALGNQNIHPSVGRTRLHSTARTLGSRMPRGCSRQAVAAGVTDLKFNGIGNHPEPGRHPFTEAHAKTRRAARESGRSWTL